MSQPPRDPTSTDDDLHQEFQPLWDEVDRIWVERSETPAFQSYVSADYAKILECLKKLQGKACTFLEWGSGLGVVTIMASRLGFDAYGIEAESELVDYSNEFASDYGVDARFAVGSFIPDEFEWEPESGDELRSLIDMDAAYDELDMELRDFDIVYGFPWPDEHALFHRIMRRFGANNALFVSYDAREGLEVARFNATN